MRGPGIPQAMLQAALGTASEFPSRAGDVQPMES
jgi:hypothetical protein